MKNVINLSLLRGFLFCSIFSLLFSMPTIAFAARDNGDDYPDDGEACSQEGAVEYFRIIGKYLDTFVCHGSVLVCMDGKWVTVCQFAIYSPNVSRCEAKLKKLEDDNPACFEGWSSIDSFDAQVGSAESGLTSDLQEEAPTEMQPNF